jgi:hypothetical protein
MIGTSDTIKTAAGIAALSICESLLLALGDLKVLSPKGAVDIISDAAAAHRNAGDTAHEIGVHKEVAAILDRIIAGGNSVRRSRAEP